MVPKLSAGSLFTLTVFLTDRPHFNADLAMSCSVGDSHSEAAAALMACCLFGNGG